MMEINKYAARIIKDRNNHAALAASHRELLAALKWMTEDMAMTNGDSDMVSSAITNAEALAPAPCPRCGDPTGDGPLCRGCGIVVGVGGEG